MKKRIGTLYNKPIIEGDINLKTPNEIHKNELKGGENSGGSVSKYAPRYYKVAESFPYPFDEFLYFVANVKVKVDENTYIYPVLLADNALNEGKILGFAFTPFYGKTFKNVTFIYSFEEAISLLLEQAGESVDFDMLMSYFTEITEEEFYNIKPE